MLLLIITKLKILFTGFRVFEYVSFRALLSCLFSLLLTLALGNHVINWLSHLKVGQMVRTDGPQTHLTKLGTPTMGGVMIILAITITCLLFANLSNWFIWILLFTLISTGIVGFIDDYLKIILKNSQGLASRYKLCAQSVICVSIALILLYVVKLPNSTQVVIPFFKTILYPFGVVGFFALSYLVIVGSSNAVNLTDGLDGLVVIPIITVAVGLGIFAYIAGNNYFANYLLFPYVRGASEIVVFLGALIGSCLGFLWFNAYPARVFMGDVGSLAIGAVLGTIAIILRQEIVYATLGGIFVLEALSVIIQVISYKTRGKRIFLMAPIHHHFELKGWKETQVVVRFWIISIILLLISLSTIKLR